MGASGSGYLMIADISGYTDYMQASELEHATGILEGLFAAMLDRLQSPFVLSNVQGDAILAHARAGLVADGHSVIDTVEAVYFGFAHALEGMILNTTCQCNACRNLSNLDLKLLIHYGAYVDQAIAGRVELGGTDVILVHRLMKNDVVASTGIGAYAAFTEAAVNEIGVPEYFDGMAHHREDVERFDPVQLRILDMRPLWESHRDRERVVASADELFIPEVEIDIAAPVDRVWYYLTNPQRRPEWMVDVTEVTRTKTRNGRLRVGAVEHCAHGDGKTSVFTFYDWQPHEHVTRDIQVPMGATCRQTLFVHPIPTGTRVTVRMEKPVSSNPLAQFVLRAMSGRVSKRIHKTWQESLQRLNELAATADPAPLSASRDDAINQAIATRMAGNTR